jgi:hypothetical protein
MSPSYSARTLLTLSGDKFGGQLVINAQTGQVESCTPQCSVIRISGAQNHFPVARYLPHDQQTLCDISLLIWRLTTALPSQGASLS